MKALIIAFVILVSFGIAEAQTPVWVTNSFSNYLAGRSSPYQSATKVVAANGFIYVLGRTQSVGTIYGNYTIAQFSTSGTLLNSVAGSIDQDQNEDNQPIDMIADASGNLYVQIVEQFNNSTVTSNVLLLKYDASLNLIWSETVENDLTSFTNTYSNRIVMDHAGNICMTCDAGATTNGFLFTYQRIIVVSYDENGSNLYNYVYNPLPETGSYLNHDLAIDSQNDVCVACQTIGSPVPGFVINVSPQGTLQWLSVPTNEGQNSGALNNIVIDDQDNIYVLDYFYSFVYKLNESGVQQWVSSIGTTSVLYYLNPSKLILDHVGNLEVLSTLSPIVVSHKDPNASSLLVDKFNSSTGALIWKRQHGGSVGPNQYSTDARISSNGDLMIAGASGNFSMLLDYDENGILINSALYKGNDASSDFATSLAYDATDNLWILGGGEFSSESNAKFYSWLLLSYNAGSVLEEKTSVNVADASVLNVFPNPSSGKFAISFNTSKSETYTLQIFNMSNSMVLSKSGTSAAGVNLLPIDMNKVSKGSYSIVFRTSAINLQKTLIIQ